MRAVGAVLIRSLDQRWKKYVKELRRCKRNTSEEAVHDVRVATRRLLSTLTLVALVHPDEELNHIRKRLKRLFDALSPLRDTQVELLALEPKVAEYPDLAAVVTMLKVRERTLLRKIVKRIAKVETRATSRVLSRLKRDLAHRFARPTARQVGIAVVEGAAATAFAKASFMKERIIPANAATLHRHRIAFKQFRYSIEAMLPLLPQNAKSLMNAMDKYQTTLGMIQDIEVREQLVMRYLSGKPLSVRRRLAPFRAELATAKRELIQQALRSARLFNRFWKPVQY